MFGDPLFVFILPRLDLSDELVTRKIGAAFAFLFQYAFLDYRLRCDSSVIRAGHPQGVIAEHSVPTNEDVLERVVQSMAHMQRRSYVGRRDHDAVRFASGRVVGFCVKGVCLLPLASHFVFYLAGLVFRW